MSTWDDAAGVICPSCDREVFQILDGRCLPCIRAAEARADLQEKRQAELQERAKKHKLWTYRKKKRPPK